ncbi:leucine-rich repeat-containing protein 24-like [Onthophagus taurus]|uniref:leucine-rich repeat-containing protein 24-like n=1 Tax=Onthophagus taurus TaxID=166361 RepID=UPI000C20DD56|nr:leucine-rich repeat-containing protein 24-like [Onthophagus taurus]
MSKKLTLLLLSVTTLSFQCPSSCICMWKDGKETVECINKDLLVIPEGIEPGTQVLEFSGNNLRLLQKEKFIKMDLVNIQKLFLSRCKISTIDDRAFKGLTNLVELDLSGNVLDAVPTGTFLDANSLMKLFLNHNPIRTLRKASFNHLPLLNVLEMNNCEISRIEDNAFLGLHSLGWLHIKNNKLTAINGTNIFPSSLKGIDLQGNPWDCDCHMLDFHTWLQTFPMSQLTEPKCKSPVKFMNKPIRIIPQSELACLPDVSPTTFYLEIGEGKNVSLLCQVHAIPEASVQWFFQGQLLQNDSIIAPGMRLIYFIEEGHVDKRSELFIYNTNTDDNGTFICTAENPAGTVYSNFTIRVVLREETKFEPAPLHYEFLLITATAIGVSLIIIVVIMILSIIKHHRSKKEKKSGESKLHNTKDSLLQDSTEDFSDQSKESSNVILVERQQMFYNSPVPVEEVPLPTAILPNQVRTPSSLRRLQLEQNPDLINDAESTERRKDGEGQAYVNFGDAPNRSILKGSVRDLYRLSADVHLNPVGLLTTTGGDPRNYYRTLPYKRSQIGKRQSAPLVNPYVREAEIVYEYADVRYTADGYPVRTSVEETTFSEGSVHSCCSMPPVQWPSCLPASAVRINSTNSTQNTNVENDGNKKCIETQTDAVTVEEKVENLFLLADKNKELDSSVTSS